MHPRNQLVEQVEARNLSETSLLAHLSGLPDPRIDRRRRHELLDILVIAICSLLCGAEGFNDMEDFGKAKEAWFRGFLKLPNGIPSHDTFNRVLAALDPQAFLECFLRWTQSLRQAVDQEIVAIDGKALRQALNRGEPLKYVVSAWASSNRLVLGQLKVSEKSNEITAVPELLRALDLAGCIVTLDAMGCQKQIAKEIIESDADYVLALKGNQETAHEEVKSFLDQAISDAARAASGHRFPAPLPELHYTEKVEKNGGRIETRRYWHTGAIQWFADREKWEGLKSFGVVESVREIDGKVTVDRRYYLSSLRPGAGRLARAVRGHWGVENQVHWVLDVQMGEDSSRARTGHAPENLATLRRLVLNLLRRDQTKKRGIRGKQRNAGWDHQYLLHLLSA